MSAADLVGLATQVPPNERVLLLEEVARMVDLDLQEGRVVLTPEERAFWDQELAELERHPERLSPWPEVEQRLRAWLDA